ncbi:MAG: hypothetical protein FJY17_09075 [Bacteroidetes bacterium]|nr:hypothetical protein [Bacteroidota bacterium]
MKLPYKISTCFGLTFFLLSVIIGCSLLSCDKSRDLNNPGDGNTPIDNYYIQYSIRAPGPYGRFSNWTASTPSGTYTNSGLQVSSWNQTYGPVQKGFSCRVQIGNYQGGTPTIEIYVSKNSEPFALKVSTMGSFASYVVN